jgi:Family of unknown function (DUF5989)
LVFRLNEGSACRGLAENGLGILTRLGNRADNGGDVGILRSVVELFAFLVHSRAWWMIPIVAGLLMLGLMIIVAEATPLGPFIYSLI